MKKVAKQPQERSIAIVLRKEKEKTQYYICYYVI
jgi:hypothetical protein